MNTQMLKQHTNDRSMIVPFGLPRSLFETPFLSRVLEMSLPNNLMRDYTTEDGSSHLEYNMAGFELEDIKLKVDTAINELVISARSDKPDNKRMFTTTVGLSPYTTPEDISTHYKNGVLRISIAPLEKRKEESLIDIPLVSDKVTTGYTAVNLESSVDSNLIDKERSENEGMRT